MADGPPSPKRVCIKLEEIENLPRDELIQKWKEHEIYVNHLEEKRKSTPSKEDENKESEEKLKQQHIEAARRENTLVMRLTSKEQELQEYMTQIQEMKQSQSATTAQLRSMLLDPAVNLVFTRMQKEVVESKEKLELTQNELSAWKFTPDSQTGKRLMAKCRMLYQENEELGKVLSSGRIARLEGEIALEKTLVEEMKKNQAELDEFLGEIDEDVEGMQSMICVLQQELKEAKEEIARLQQENQVLQVQIDKQAQPDTPLNNHSPEPCHTGTTYCEPEEIRSPSEVTPSDNQFPDSAESSDKQGEESMEVDSTDLLDNGPCEPVKSSSPTRSLPDCIDQVTSNSNHSTTNSHTLPEPQIDCPSPTRTSPDPGAQNGNGHRTTKDGVTDPDEKTTDDNSSEKVQNGVTESWQQAEGSV